MPSPCAVTSNDSVHVRGPAKRSTLRRWTSCPSRKSSNWNAGIESPVARSRAVGALGGGGLPAGLDLILEIDAQRPADRRDGVVVALDELAQPVRDEEGHPRVIALKSGMAHAVVSGGERRIHLGQALEDPADVVGIMNQ